MQSRTLREGSLGLFVLAGISLLAGSLLWLRNLQFGKAANYRFEVSFPDINGVVEGAAVNYRGSRIGTVSAIETATADIIVVLDVESDVVIPRESEILANSAGLVGETSVDITPPVNISESALAQDPRAQNCDHNQVICAGDQVNGQPGPQLVPTLARLNKLYGSQEFYDNLQNTAQSTSLAATRIAVLSNDLSLLAQAVLEDVDAFSSAADSIAETATETQTLVKNLNSVILDNQAEIASALENTNATTQELNRLIVSSNQLVQDTNSDLNKVAQNVQTSIGLVNDQLAQLDTSNLVTNLETLTSDAATVTNNLRLLSESLNDPANIVTLQQTLDSARATFENTRKITSDLDELTGDPNFRRNIKELVNGLGNLLSTTQQLNEQLQTAQNLQKNSQNLRAQLETLKQLEESVSVERINSPIESVQP
ncbi:MAG: MlaD family protein [Cyanobacteria bacterium P01_H01_bin.15]